MTGNPKGASWVLGWLLMLTILIGFVPPAKAELADHLIISEIVVITRATDFPRWGSPYIQVVNPTASAVDMSDVHLTDGNSSTSAYFNLPLADLDDNHPGGGNNYAFHVRFPDGYSLAAGDSLAISVNGSDQYELAYGRLPDFELFEDGSSIDAVPEMVMVFPGSIGMDESVEDAVVIYSSLVLYSWDGVGDAVEDLDYVVWGPDPNTRIDKTGVTIGSHTYADDTAVGDQSVVNPITHNPGFSFRRNDTDEGTEITSLGNGLTGHDETSENFGDTWAMVNVGNVGHGIPAAPGSHHPTAPIFSAGSFSPARPVDGEEVELSATVISSSAINTTFHYSVDGGAYVDLIGVNTTGDDFTATVPGQAENSIVTWYCTADNAGGGEAVYPAGSPAFAEAWTIFEAPDPSLFPTKLLVTEVCTKGNDEEFVEIFNPSDHEVDLSDYAFCDAVYNGSSGHNGYYFMGAGAGPSTTGGGVFYDFIARFPEGFTIASGDTIVISIAGSGPFSASYNYLPDLELYEDDDFPDLVPDMRPVYELGGGGNSIINETVPTLTNDGEPIVLFHWNDGDDLVTDIDIFTWGPGGSYSVARSNVSVGSSTYLDDTPQGLQAPFTAVPDFGQSYTRVDGDEGTQSPIGGNGVAGRDETSENWTATFQLETASPSRPGGTTGGGDGSIVLNIEAKTFIPTEGELIPIRFVSKTRSETKVRIFDLEGRVVHTLYDSRRNGPASVVSAAPTVVAWDGRDKEYKRVRAGMYIVHLLVVNQQTGEQEFQTAPVVVATRLSR